MEIPSQVELLGQENFHEQGIANETMLVASNKCNSILNEAN